MGVPHLEVGNGPGQVRGQEIAALIAGTVEQVLRPPLTGLSANLDIIERREHGVSDRLPWGFPRLPLGLQVGVGANS